MSATQLEQARPAAGRPAGAALAAHAGYPAAFLLTAALVVPALALALRERRPLAAPVPPPAAAQE